MTVNKKYLLFISVFILLIIAIIYRMLNPFVQSKVDKLTFTGQKSRKINNGVSDRMGKTGTVDNQSSVSRFLNKPDAPVTLEKDLFSIYHPPRKTRLKLPVKKDIQDKKTTVAVKTDPIQEVKDYISSYTFYGSYVSKDKKAVFLAKNKLVLVAEKGDRLDGKYVIDDIQDNYIRIKALDLNETLHLDMREFNNE